MRISFHVKDIGLKGCGEYTRELPGSCRSYSQPSRCTCEGLRLKSRDYPHSDHAHLPHRMGIESHCYAPRYEVAYECESRMRNCGSPGCHVLLGRTSCGGIAFPAIKRASCSCVTLGTELR